MNICFLSRGLFVKVDRCYNFLKGVINTHNYKLLMMV